MAIFVKERILLLKKRKNADIIEVMKARKIKVFFALAFFASGLLSAQNRPVAKLLKVDSTKSKCIGIEWEFPKKTEPEVVGIKIYRAKRPYTNSEDIENDLPIAELKASQNFYEDVLNENSSFFYAVIAQTKNGLYKIIIPGINASAKGVRPKVPAAKEQEPVIQEDDFISTIDPSKLSESQKELYYADNNMRKAPLPNPGALLGFDKPKTKMSGKAIKSAKELGSKKERKPFSIKSPYFFEVDMFSPDGGDEYTLFETLRAGLAPKKYEESVKLLKDFLSVHRNKETSERAQFYLGQSYYFCKDYKNAIRCFLDVQDAYPELSKQWIDSSLDLLEID